MQVKSVYLSKIKFYTFYLIIHVLSLKPKNNNNCYQWYDNNNMSDNVNKYDFL